MNHEELRKLAEGATPGPDAKWHGEAPKSNQAGAQSVAVPDGYMLVKIVPDDAMQLAGAQAVRIDTTVLNKMYTANRVFKDMCNASQAPAPEQAQPPGVVAYRQVQWKMQREMTGLEQAQTVDEVLLPAVLALDAAIHTVLIAGGDYGDDLSDTNLRSTLKNAQHMAYRALISIGIERLPGAVNPLRVFLPKDEVIPLAVPQARAALAKGGA